jgi:hypothetical protein
MHLLPGVLEQHLAAIGREESYENIASVLLHGLRFDLLQPCESLAIKGDVE